MKYFIIILFSIQFVFSQKNIDKKKYDSIRAHYLTIAKENEVWEPEPDVVKPVIKGSSPSDAIILFDGSDLSKWHHSNSNLPVEWTLNKDKSMTVVLGTGSIETKFEHGSIQLHIEWKTPKVISGDGQSRGNSGIYFQRRYEVQILDSYNNRTYSNGQAGAIYKQSIPLVNASLPPGQWQVYDIVFNEPKYDADGKQIKSGTFTVFHNGVLVHNNAKIHGTTSFIGMHETDRDSFPLDGQKGGTHRSLLLQDHGDGKVSYRNIWMRKL
tara:strand:+ start:1033 stop:1836 length:804 start_codon:yes stop_codon:yes gene_type:complete